MVHPLAVGLTAVLNRQLDVVARYQLIEAGLDDVAICRKVRRGAWQRILPGVYVMSAEKITTEQKRVAGALYAGETAQLTGLGALHWHGFRHAPITDRVHVLVAHETRRRSVGFLVVQRTLSLDEKARPGDLYTVTSAARAVVDACRGLSELTDIRAIIAEAVQGQHTSLEAIDEEVRRANRSRTSLTRRALGEIADGVRSAPEANLRDIVRSSKVLGEALWNPVLEADGQVLPTPDGLLPDAAIALEVDSRSHHSSPDDWERTLQRHNLLSQHGILVLHFTPKEIRDEPARVRRMIEHAYLERVSSGVRVRVSVRAPC
jgi:hypothetical protein